MNSFSRYISVTRTSLCLQFSLLPGSINESGTDATEKGLNQLIYKNKMAIQTIFTDRFTHKTIAIMPEKSAMIRSWLTSV